MKIKTLFVLLIIQVFATVIVLPIVAEAPGRDCPTGTCDEHITSGQIDWTEMSGQCPAHPNEDIRFCQSGSFEPNPDGTKCCEECCPVCNYPENSPPPN